MSQQISWAKSSTKQNTLQRHISGINQLQTCIQVIQEKEVDFSQTSPQQVISFKSAAKLLFFLLWMTSSFAKHNT